MFKIGNTLSKHKGMSQFMDRIGVIRKNVVDGNVQQVVKTTKACLEAGVDPLIIINDGLVAGMNIVGPRFKAGGMFVPEVLMSAKALHAGMDLLKSKMLDIESVSYTHLMPVEGRKIFFGPGSDCLNILDHRTGKRRKPVLQDVVDGVSLCDALPNIDFVMSMVLPTDVNTAMADRYQMEIMLNFTKKPLVFVTYDFEGCSDAVEMAEAVAGGTEELRRNPNVVCYINVTTGLRHNAEALQKLIFLSKKGLPFIYAPDIYGGITGPVTMPGSVAHIIAGVFTGLVLSQLEREGTPFIMPGWAGTTMDKMCIRDRYEELIFPRPLVSVPGKLCYQKDY